ncbi:MAG: hypothetical protein DWH91_07800 [Planctomycetota bacterium]|nr:MAG: hypothetical protein DWH91_07800 [Planctomycetota bacterium]
MSELRTHGVLIEDTRIWVIHRRLRYGPFDYEWIPNLRGIELTFCGRKFGEILSEEEIYADLREFRLPMRVVEVAVLVLGNALYSGLNGYNDFERRGILEGRLMAAGCDRFLPLEFY